MVMVNTSIATYANIIFYNVNSNRTVQKDTESNEEFVLRREKASLGWLDRLTNEETDAYGERAKIIKNIVNKYKDIFIWSRAIPIATSYIIRKCSIDKSFDNFLQKRKIKEVFTKALTLVLIGYCLKGLYDGAQAVRNDVVKGIEEKQITTWSGRLVLVVGSIKKRSLFFIQQRVGIVMLQTLSIAIRTLPFGDYMSLTKPVVTLCSNKAYFGVSYVMSLVSPPKSAYLWYDAENPVMPDQSTIDRTYAVATRYSLFYSFLSGHAANLLYKAG